MKDQQNYFAAGAPRVHRKRYAPLNSAVRQLVLGGLLGLTGASAAQAYVGDSFISIPGTEGSWKGEEFANWIRAEAMYWPTVPVRVFTFQSDGFAGERMTFGSPGAPPEGAGSQLIISMSKTNPDTSKLMALCANKTEIPEITYAESSERSRPVLEVGPRPDDIPAYWQYTLKKAQITDCPVVKEAAEQAFVFSFKDIKWGNYASDGPPVIVVKPKPEDYPEVKPAAAADQATTKAFVVSWFGVAGQVSEDQCPTMNTRPSEDDYYAFMSKEEAAQERKKNGEKGVDYGRQMGYRGPNKLSVVNLPGIIKDPGFVEPTSTKAYGVNLDGHDGTGEPPQGVCKHKNYTSVDDRLAGVDNQLFTVVGCYSGFQGKKGYRNQTSNARRADGNIVTLIEISGIDDAQNDDSVVVKIVHGKEKPLKDAAGSTYLPYSSFTPSNEPQFKYFNRQFSGRIVDGVVVTDPIADFELNTGLQDPLLEMTQAQMRLTIMPDESLKGVLAGYLDWKRFMTLNRSSYSENLFGFQAPGLYSSLKRNADGLLNPQTGECDGISAAYEIEAVPAFLLADETVATSAN